MDIKKNCDDWMIYVYKEWLDGLARKEHDSYLRESTKNMIERMKKAAHLKKTEEAWNLLERLKRLNEGFDSEARIEKYKYEKPESYMECALTAYELGDLRDALELFHIAIGHFPNSAYKAICYWMAGCVQWQLPSRSESAVLSWERSLQVMSDFSSEKLDYVNGLAEKEIKDNCKKAIKDMRGAINKATRDGYPHLPPPESTDTKNKHASSAYSARLKFLPYFGAIPAGDPAVVDNHPDMVDVDSLEIEGCSYKIYGIRKEREVRMKPSSRYFLAKADGHSMNIAQPVNIEDKDYVLLHNTQEAQNNDIVAAVVFDPTGLETATLKRYKVEYGRQFLKFESDREEREIPMLERDYIQGVVVAILKPIDD
jgi:tetratricopeptide (TPR) repeat protein